MVTIEDVGRGMPGSGRALARLRGRLPSINGPGLGLVRMRERLHRVGGKLEIQSVTGRTIVRGTIPVANRYIAEGGA